MDRSRSVLPNARTRSRRAGLVLLAGASLAVGLLGPVTPALAASTPILSAGPLTRVEISNDLNCAVDHVGDSAPEFFGDTACGTLVAVGGTLFGPASIPAGGSASPLTAFTPISQSAVLGAGTNVDPYRIVTVVGLGTTGLQITETDSYVVGQETYRTDVMVNNTGASSADAILYRAGDCYLQGSDFGFGAADANGAVSCVAGVLNGTIYVPGTRIEQWYPLSSGSFYHEDGFNEVWAKIGSQTAFDNLCVQCANYIDNGAGLSWNVTIPAGGSATRSHLTVFSPLGVVPLTTAKTASQPSVAAGAADSYTITVSNPNIVPATLASITDTLPAGFSYTSRSTTGATTTNPGIVGQVLTWTGPFTVPASGNVALTFGVTVSSTPGTYSNEAGAVAQGQFTVVGTGPTAPVVVTGTQPLPAHLTLTKTVDNTGGGTALATAWTLTATGPTTISGHTGDTAITNAAVTAGTYALTESGGPAGYTAGTWSCTAGTLTGSSLILAPDATATCTIRNTFVPVRTVGLIAPTETTCQQYVAGTASALSRINYAVLGGLIRQNINPGVFFYFSTVNVSAGGVVTTSQSTTSSSGKLFLLLNGHAFVYDANCNKIGLMSSTNGGATGSMTFATAGTYILQLQYQTKSLADTAAPNPANPTFTFDTEINGSEVVPDTTSISLFLR